MEYFEDTGIAFAYLNYQRVTYGPVPPYVTPIPGQPPLPPAPPPTGTTGGAWTCTFYGNLPVVFFFPELARSQLEGYRHYQREDGAAPFVIGRWGPPDMATPGWDWQISLNGPVYAILADRLWQRHLDACVRHFVDSRAADDAVSPEANRKSARPWPRSSASRLGQSRAKGSATFSSTPERPAARSSSSVRAKPGSSRQRSGSANCTARG